MAAKHIFTSIKALPAREIAPGVTIKPLAGQHVMLNYVELMPHTEVRSHAHPHEQLGLVLEGELELRIGDETRSLGPGDTFFIPGGVTHSARAKASRAIAVDVFYPLREDYLKLFAGADAHLS